MCFSGGGGGNQNIQIMIAQEQQRQAAETSAAALAEQQREFDVSQQNRAADLAAQQEQQAKQQAQIDQQAALTQQYQTRRTQEAGEARDAITSAFAQFTPEYYSGYVNTYKNLYQPEIQRQYELAQKNLGFGLARQGITQSQSAATQARLLAEQKGRNEAELGNKAIDASTALQQNVENAKGNLLQTALSDQTLGSPITPGSADAVSAAFDQTSRALSQIRTNAGDVVNTLNAPPTYNALGNLFSNVASGVGSYVLGNQYYNAYGGPPSGGPSSSAPTSSSSYRTVG